MHTEGGEVKEGDPGEEGVAIVHSRCLISIANWQCFKFYFFTIFAVYFPYYFLIVLKGKKSTHFFFLYWGYIF